MNWDDIWNEKKYVTDFSLRWLDFLSRRDSSLPEGAKVLEAGCGSGEGIAVFAAQGKVTVGLDISKEAVTKTVSRLNVLTVRGDNFALPFQAETFDLVYNSGVIEHFKYPQNVRQLEEMARVTKSGGEVIINVPNTLCLWYIGIKKILLLIGKWRFGYEESYTPLRLKRTVEDAGIRLVGITGFLCIPPFATDNFETLPLKVRKVLASIEKFLPFKQYYCYSVCALCKKD